MQVIKVVGMDPSLSNFGIAKASLDVETLKILDITFELGKTKPEQDAKTRKVVRKNSEDLERAKLLLASALDATQDAVMAFVEVPVGSQSARAMASYGICLGVLAAVEGKLPMIQVTPSEVKLVGAGVKTATKEEMIKAMVAKYPDAPWPRQTIKGETKLIASSCEHLADALAAIEAGIATQDFKRTLAMFKSTPLFQSLMKRAA
ncbi:hypothetical protein [Herbaspirillum huttiense]|uniref:Uncharacterized protein n=1 Tax=Herbaspirillum huttiense subsp. lycopersici TaxID=3074428 RepID=A0ABU2EG39_9BURK|nr:hypothetical protein [Herbaspirillum huttiense]MDR9847109.1 hypothetical protein [Herbaspirillum huttiense SE1]